MPDFYTTCIENRGGSLFIGGVSASALAEKFGTPLYVMDEQRIRQNYLRLQAALGRNYQKVRIHYAMKANSNLNVLKILNSEGAYIDAVSANEALAALQAGFPKERVLFTGTNATGQELAVLAQNGIRVNIDSHSAFERLQKIKKPEFISFRINPETGAGAHSHVITGGPDSKFGIWEADAVEAYARAKAAGVRTFGIHMHIGSNVLDVTDFTSALSRFMDIAGNISEKNKIKFEFIDIGGGLGVPYRPETSELDLDAYSNEIFEIFKAKLEEHGMGEPYFCVEPGRYIVADAAVLLTRVNTLKQTPHMKFAGIDAGFNVLIRPAMYDSYHHILVDGKLDKKVTENYDVVGPICESGDFIARNRKLPKLGEGDLLAVLTAGAYGYSMSSNYNLRARAAEVLVNQGKYELVREPYTLEKILSGQKKAAWLQ
ncbi:Diaminopimelate decarboxylase [uncultured archaeon]|nr:Diaminopimelate decarboxylase [uncultured archaeon]